MKIEEQLAEAFVCAKCGNRSAHVERLAMSGTGISRLLEIQLYRYAYVTCDNCAFTEVYDLKILEGKDDLGSIFEIIFAD